MKIVHVCVAQYSDGWTYQENLLTKYHKKMGLDVVVITSMYCYKEGALVKDTNKIFTDVNGVKVVRLETKSEGILGKFPTYIDFYETICEEKPDIIFSHGCQYKDATLLVKYVKEHPHVKMFVDNHADYSNSATNLLSKVILHKMIWRYYTQKLIPYTEMFWGVLPARVDFLQEVYGVPKEKCKLLVMGADDEIVREADDEHKIFSLRGKYGINADDFLIVTGGKIDSAKLQTSYLMEAVNQIKSDKAKLIVFGSIEEKIREQILQWVDNKKVIYVGWISPEQSYEYFAAADLVVFPGRHSVFWEQVAGQGIPMLVKDWNGTHHVDLGGNVKFLQDDSVAEIRNMLESIVENEDEYRKMKACAVDKAKKYFSYQCIAQRSIES